MRRQRGRKHAEIETQLLLHGFSSRLNSQNDAFEPLPRSTTTANSHHTAELPSNLQTYLDVISSSSAANLVALDPCQLDLVDPVPLHPLDPQQPQTVITLRNSRRLFKPTSDCMARSHTQRLVAPDLPVGISKRTSDDMPSNVQTYLDAMLSSSAAHLVNVVLKKPFRLLLRGGVVRWSRP